MQAARLLIAVLAATLVVASLAVVALAAPAALRLAADPHASAAAAEYCPPGEEARREAAVKRYQKQMVAAKKAYFRRTRSLKLRKAFVKKQAAQLKALQRVLKACE